MKVIREVSIKKVEDGYILEDLLLPPEVRIYKDFGELVDWVALLFDERKVNEKIELAKKEREV